MKAQTLRFLSVVAVLALVTTLVVFVMPAQPAAAKPSKDAEQGGTDKVLIFGTQPGMTIAAYQGVGQGADGTPFGIFEGATTAPLDGKVLELFVPVGAATSLYLSGPKGFELIGVVGPTRGDQPVTLSIPNSAPAMSAPGAGKLPSQPVAMKSPSGAKPGALPAASARVAVTARPANAASFGYPDTGSPLRDEYGYMEGAAQPAIPEAGLQPPDEYSYMADMASGATQAGLPKAYLQPPDEYSYMADMAGGATQPTIPNPDTAGY
jgi:hypothetical protein